MSQRFSSRTGWDLRESSYAVALREAREAGRTLCDLTVSNPARCGFSYDDEAILAALSNVAAMAYEPDPRGMPKARQAVAAYYADHGAGVDPGKIMLTTSTSESYSYLFKLLCNPGDEVLVAQPSYPLFDFLADLDDVQLKPYPLFYDHGWWIDFAELERAISPRTRAILVVHPNNPTGHWTGVQEREQLEGLCARREIALIVDEVFLDYPLRDAVGDAHSFVSGSHPALTFVLSGISKVCGLPQMKVAWLVALGPENRRREALSRLEMIADTFLSMNAPVQLALPVWLGGRAGIQRQIGERMRANLRAINEAVAKGNGGIQLLQVDAGWSAVLSLASCAGERACAERLIREQAVVVHPGSFYGMSEANRAVVSLIGPEVEMRRGLERILGRDFNR